MKPGSAEGHVTFIHYTRNAACRYHPGLSNWFIFTFSLSALKLQQIKRRCWRETDRLRHRLNPPLWAGL